VRAVALARPSLEPLPREVRRSRSSLGGRIGSTSFAAEIEQQAGVARAIGADITQRHEAVAAVQDTVDRFGRVDTVVNNAGVMYLAEPRRDLELPYVNRPSRGNHSGARLFESGLLPRSRV
jgi:NAD(P)-dependent dehydrogenase (short-subunit alcohol dehydrogenase family)